MTTAFAIKVILMVLAVLFVSYGLLHEDKFIAFEDMVIKAIRKRIILHKRSKALEKRRQQGRDMRPVSHGQPQVKRQETQVQRRRVA